MKSLKIIVLACLCLLILPFVKAQTDAATDVDSLGKLWVITVDLSGSMIDKSPVWGNGTKEKAQNTATIVANRLKNCRFFDDIDYKKDRFLFFISGYLQEQLQTNEPRFDTCFIHHTDQSLHTVLSQQELFTQIKHLLDHSQYAYKYKQSFVSQIETFSLVKASNFLKKQKAGTQFRKIWIVTLTDDAEGTLQWQNDLKNISCWDPKKVKEIGEVTSRYIYNDLTGQGAGTMEQLYLDDGWHVHIKVLECRSRAAAAQTNNTAALFKIFARDGKTITLTCPAKYQQLPIGSYFLDSISINGKVHRLNKVYPADTKEITLKIPYTNENHENQFKLFGRVQVLYNDTIFGQHYRKVFFSQQDTLMSKVMITHLVVKIVTAVLLLVIAIVLLFFFIPKRKLFTLTMGGKRFEVRRGYRWNWKRTGNQLFACRQDHDGKLTNALCAGNPLIRIATGENRDDDVILIESSKSIDFKADMQELGREDLPIVEFEVQKNSINGRHRYTLKVTGEEGYIAFRVPQLDKVVLIQVIGAKATQLPAITNAEYRALSEYFQQPPTERCNALVCGTAYLDDIVWSVLLPEYDDGAQMPLMRVRRLFAFHQKNGAAQINQIKMLAQLLRKQVEKYQPKCKKIVCKLMKSNCLYSAATPSSNIYRLEMIDATCHGFICLKEASDVKPYEQVLYSPMSDHGLESVIPVSTPKLRTKRGFIYQTFLPMNELDKLPDYLQQTLSFKIQSYINFEEAKNFESIVFDKNTLFYNIVHAELQK